LFSEILIYGLVQGCILALFALGFSLVYGVGGILNLSHGGFYLITCYVIFKINEISELWVAMTIGIIVVVLIGAFTYIALIKPLQHSPVGVLIVTFAFGFLIEQFVSFSEGTGSHAIYPPWFYITLDFFGLHLQFFNIVVIVGASILVTVVILFIKKTKLGKSIRAVAQDREAAQLMGINTDRILIISLIISALLAGSVAILYAGNTFQPADAWRTLLVAFAVTIFGGMGSISGSIIGAFIMGYAMTITQYLPGLGQYSALVPIVIIMIMLIIRPQGLLGKKEVK
jgi:branched-chain amino acid transport system permease protein